MSTSDLGIVGLSVVLLAAVIIMVLILIVRGLRRKSGASPQAMPAVKSRPVAKATKSGSDKVQIESSGRAGSINYAEGGNKLKLYWEFGGGDAIVTVWAPSEEKWDAEVPWAKGRRKELLEMIAADVVRQKAPGCKVRWKKDFFEIVK